MSKFKMACTHCGAFVWVKEEELSGQEEVKCQESRLVKERNNTLACGKIILDKA